MQDEAVLNRQKRCECAYFSVFGSFSFSLENTLRDTMLYGSIEEKGDLLCQPLPTELLTRRSIFLRM